ncbi:winged helix-turn-helix domain-containing protein [Methanosarcina hadiensis]|uniref:winged helix-turn-helix transcriptional regulator n=1 Tax=Methanosarcina hadiensis TaxID=3078083 RepID=UPI003977A9AC
MRGGKFTGAFQNSYVLTDNDRIMIAHLKGDTRKQIFLNILEKPEITNQELSEKLNLDKGTAHWHNIKRLKMLILFSMKVLSITFIICACYLRNFMFVWHESAFKYFHFLGILLEEYHVRFFRSRG